MLRGGYGKYYTQLENDAAHQSNLNIQTIIPEVALRRPRRLRDESVGRIASRHIEQAQARLCSTALTPACIRREITSEIPTTFTTTRYSHQTMVGISRQTRHRIGPSK